jgi:hypothetical protein
VTENELRAAMDKEEAYLSDEDRLVGTPAKTYPFNNYDDLAIDVSREYCNPDDHGVQPTTPLTPLTRLRMDVTSESVSAIQSAVDKAVNRSGHYVDG